MRKGVDAVVTISNRYISTYKTGDLPLSPTRYGAVTQEVLDQRWEAIRERIMRNK